MPSCFRFRVYSSTICSDIALPLGESITGPVSSDILFRRAEKASLPDTHYWIEILNSQGRTVHLQSRDPFDSISATNVWLLSVENVATFWWQGGQRQICYFTSGATNPGYWLIHLVLPLFKRLEEQVLMMHAAAVEIDNRAVLISAASFGGKSTLTHALLDLGHTFMADDKLGLFIENETLMCSSSYPRCRNYRATEDLGKPVAEHQPSSLAVGGIYILTRSDPEAAVSIEALRGYRAFSLLQENRDIPLSFLRQQEFLRLGTIARLAPVFQLKLPWSLQRVTEVASEITDHQTRLRQQSGHDESGRQRD